jgi:hypothetical protein
MTRSGNQNKPHPTTRLNSKFNKSLSAYIAAAGAAGVALTAASPSAEAKVVYTPANTRLYNGTFPIDLNNDGVADISLIAAFQVYSFYRTYLHVSPGAGNAVVGVAAGAAQLAWGVRIGPNVAFDPAAQLIESEWRCQSSYCSAGAWGNGAKGYLGIKFQINGQTHYGWARLSIGRLPATLTGYAYETIPNKPIIAGKRSEASESAAVRPDEVLAPGKTQASLAMLARGADSIAIWRREEEAAVPKRGLIR